jgi:hypothetical protein
VSRLMPTGSFRWCPLGVCGHRWFVAHPGACDCPKCGTAVADAKHGWPHVCTNGHAADHGGECGECGECAVEAVDKVKRKRARQTEAR